MAITICLFSLALNLKRCINNKFFLPSLTVSVWCWSQFPYNYDQTIFHQIWQTFVGSSNWEDVIHLLWMFLPKRGKKKEEEKCEVGAYNIFNHLFHTAVLAHNLLKKFKTKVISQAHLLESIVIRCSLLDSF